MTGVDVTDIRIVELLENQPRAYGQRQPLTAKEISKALELGIDETRSRLKAMEAKDVVCGVLPPTKAPESWPAIHWYLLGRVDDEPES